MKNMNVNEVQNLLGKVELIDVRETYEYANGHIPTAKNIPLQFLMSNTENYLNKDTEYYIVCQSGGRSNICCEVLSSKGYNVVNLAGGTGFYNGELEY